MPYTAVQIADLIGGTVIGDGTVPLSGIAPAVSAKQGDLTVAKTISILSGRSRARLRLSWSMRSSNPATKL